MVFLKYMLNLSKYLKNNTISLRVVPHSSRSELVEEDGKLKLYLHALPEKNKANLELIKFFKKEYGLRVEIKSGEKGREKVIVVV